MEDTGKNESIWKQYAIKVNVMADLHWWLLKKKIKQQIDYRRIKTRSYAQGYFDRIFFGSFKILRGSFSGEVKLV